MLFDLLGGGAAGGHHADGKLHDAAGRVGERAVLSRIPARAISPSIAITRDQVEDYARRKGWKLKEAEKWLAPVLAYDPE